MTYLEIVNKVLRRMREQTVASVSENTYSLMIGEFVNDAKRAVESAWQWRALLDTVTVVTSGGGVTSYDLEDFNCSNTSAPPRENARLYIDPESSIPMIRITDDNEETLITKVSQSHKFIDRQIATNDSNFAKPESIIFGVNPTAASGNTNIRIFPIPRADAAYNIQIYIVNPQNDLSSNDTTILVPNEPILQLAYLYALYERGEELGEVLTLTSQKAEQALADAISHDSSMTSEIVFRTE